MAQHARKSFIKTVIIFFLVSGSFDVFSQENEYNLQACGHELYKSIPRDQAVGGKYITNNQLGDANTAYAENLNCSSYIPYPEGGSIVLKFNLFAIEYDSESDNCEWDQFYMDGEKHCGILTGLEMCFSGGSQLDLRLVTDDYTDESYHGLDIRFDTYLNNQCTCTTLPPEGEESQPCIFPFLYQGIKYWSCVSDIIIPEASGSFCATSVNEADQSLITAGSCDPSIFECQTVCKTQNEGKRCIFPAFFGGIERNTCFARNTNDGDKTHCSLIQLIDFDGNQKLGKSALCGSQCGTFLVCDDENLVLKSGQFSSPGYQPETDNTYDFNEDCGPSIQSEAADNYYVTLTALQLACDEKDFLEFKSSFSDDVKVFRFCGSISQDFSFCWSSDTPDSVDLKMWFKSGPDDPDNQPANRRELDGFVVDFKSAETSESGPCLPKVQNDNACTSENQVINSDYEIVSFDYPRPYPADLDCTWTIEADSNKPDTIPVIQIESIDLGQQWDTITKRDTLTLKNSGFQDDRVITLENDDSQNVPFVLIGQSGSVTFTSTFYFNFHNNFKLNVTYYTIAENTDVFVSAGLCLSEDHSDFCLFPFTVDGESFNRCSKLQGDTKAWCRNWKDEKIHCDMQSTLCLPPIPDFAPNSLQATFTSQTAARITWQVENANWDKFKVTVNDDTPVEVTTESFDAEGLTQNVEYLVEIQIISFEREGPIASISFTHTGETFGVFATSSSPGSLNLIWNAFPNSETSYTITVEPQFSTAVSQALFTDKTGVAPSSVEADVTSQNYESLRAGLLHKATVEGFKDGTFTTKVETSKFIMPNNFDINTNKISVELVAEKGLLVNGQMTPETYCEQLNVRVEMLTNNAGEETFDLVAEKQCAVDECVDPENDFNFKDFLALEESQLTPGASYKILIYGSSQGVKAPEQVTLSYIREPEVVSNIHTTSFDTTSIAVAWDPPSGQFSHFIVHVTQTDGGDYDQQHQVTKSQLVVSGLAPGHSYMFGIQTVSHGDTGSSTAAEQTFGTVPLKASSFTAVRISPDNPSLITFQVLPPATDGWTSMELMSEALVFQEIPDQPLANITFPLTLTNGVVDLQVEYSQKGSLYSATVEVISAMGHRSANLTKIFASAPSQLESVELTFMNDEYMNLTWALAKATSFFNQVTAKVTTSDGLTSIYDATTEVAEQEESGTITINLNGQSASSTFSAILKSVVVFSEYDVTVNSIDTTLAIDPVIPVIKEFNPVTLTSMTAVLDLTGFEESDTFKVTIKKPSTDDVIATNDVTVSGCTSQSACPTKFSSLDPGSNYVITSAVEQSELPFRITDAKSQTTNAVPTDFEIDSQSTTLGSFSLGLSLSNKPFGDDPEIKDFAFIVGPQGADESSLLQNIQQGTTWAQNAVSTSSQIYIASPKQAYSSIALDSNQKWTGTIGDNSNCDPQASSVICNGPLLPDETYNVWVAGWTESGKIVVSQKLSDLKTTKDDVSSASVTSQLSVITVEFDNTLPETAKYTATVSIQGSTDVISSQELDGSSCASDKCTLTLVDLDPGSSYSVQVTPQLSGVDRPAFTGVATTAALPEITVQQTTPTPGSVNPSRSFTFQTSGVPFGDHASITQFYVIVASNSFSQQLTDIPDSKYSDVEATTQFSPYLPFGPQSYPPALTQGLYQVTIGGQDCSGLAAANFCNGNLLWSSDFKIWFATIPANSQKALISGPYSVFSTAALEIDEPTVLERNLLSLDVGYPVEGLPPGTILDVEVLSNGEVLQTIDGVVPTAGTKCTLSANGNHCIVTVANLDIDTEYTVKFVPRDEGLNIPTLEVTGKTRPMPSVELTPVTDNQDPYTTLQLSMSGLPFGQNDDVTSYWIIVSSNENSASLTYTDDVWSQAASSNWTPYNVFGTLSYSDLISEANQGGSNTWSLVIGQDFPCSGDNASPCNGPLEPGNSYAIKIIGETSSGTRLETNNFEGFACLPVSIALTVVSTTLTGMKLQFDKLQQSTTITYTITVSLGDEVKKSKVINPSGCSANGVCDVTIDGLEAAQGYLAKLFIRGFNQAEASDITIKRVEELVPPEQVNVKLTQDSNTQSIKSYTAMSLSMDKLPFGNTMEEGGVMTYAVVVSMNTGGNNRARRSTDAAQLKFTNNTWKYASDNGWPPYLINSPNEQYPPSDQNQNNSWSVEVGAEYPCSNDVTVYCNGPLAPGSSVSVAMIGYSEEGFPVLSESTTELTTKTYQVESLTNVVGKLTSVDIEFFNGMPSASFPNLVFRAQVWNSTTSPVVFTHQLAADECDSITNKCSMSVGGLEPQTSYSLEVTPILKQMLMEPTPQQSIQTIPLPTISVTIDTNAEDDIDASTQIALQIYGLPFGRSEDDSRIQKYSILIGQSNNDFTQQLLNYPEGIKNHSTAESSDLYQAQPLTNYPPNTTNDSTVWLVTLGAQDCQTVQTGQCNGPLSPSTSYNLWFVAEIEGYGFLITSAFGPFSTSAGPGSDSQEGYQIANLSPLFIVVGIILLIILVIVLFVFMRRRGKIRIYPFLSYFTPKERKKLYAYEAYDGLSERDSSTPRLHDSPELTQPGTGPLVDVPDAPPGTTSSGAGTSSRELPYHSTLKSTTEVISPQHPSSSSSRPMPPFTSFPSTLSSVSAYNTTNEASPYSGRRQPIFLDNPISAEVFQFSGIVPMDDSFGGLDRGEIIRPNFAEEDDEDGLVSRAPQHITAERNERTQLSPHPYLDLASEMN